MSNRITPTIVVHGGAGRKRFQPDRLREFREGLEQAARIGLAALESAGPLAAVEAAVRSMEDSGAFNAGRGSSPNRACAVECDAAIMVGLDGSSGAVGAVPGILHPITLARKVMEETEHLLLVGEGARAIALEHGLQQNLDGPLPARLADHARGMARLNAQGGKGGLDIGLSHGAEGDTELQDDTESYALGIGEGDTVGAVAIDADGRLAAAVSTGGLLLKLPGRVGDSAILGAGLFADDFAGAAVATGIGEAILRVGLSRDAVERMRHGENAQDGCAGACRDLAVRLGPDTAGLIGIDANGRVGLAMNTEAMGRAVYRTGMPSPWVAVTRDEGPFPG